MFDYETFANTHKSIIHGRAPSYLDLHENVKKLVDSYKACGGKFMDADMAPWYTLVAYVYALQERLGLPMIMYMNRLIQDEV